MKAIILAAGYGTRLHPITLDKPKAFVDVNGKPIIDYIIEKINEIEDVDEIFIVTNNKFFYSFEEWKDKTPTNKSLVIVNDNTNSNEERLGALGDLLFVLDKEKIEEDILLVASDNLFDFDLKEMVSRAEKKDMIGVYEIDSDEIKKYGVIEIDDNNKIIGMQEKPQEPKTNLASTGVYLFRKGTLNLMRKYKDEGGNIEGPGYFLEWLHKHKDIYCHVFRGKWFDIGSLEVLERAKKAFA